MMSVQDVHSEMYNQNSACVRSLDSFLIVVFQYTVIFKNFSEVKNDLLLLLQIHTS